jgi:hypothetical protein
MAGKAYWKAVVAVSLGALLLVPGLEGWQRFRNPFGFERSNEAFMDENEKAEFFFTRLMYDGGGRRRRGGWATDWPEAEMHFLQGVRRLTNIDAAEHGRVLRPLDDLIFDHPWIYAVEVGRWDLEQEEADKLREYLLRGGFLMVDDFHGGYEWSDFMTSMQKVFPDRPIVDIPESDPLMTIVFDIDQKIQIPGVRYVQSGITWEREDGYPAHWRGIYDDDERLIVAINHNMDLGDAWEHADYPLYPERFTSLAYRFGVNYVVYAMTH